VTVPERGKVVQQIADHLTARRIGHPLRVGVDGITAAGKSILACELAVATCPPCER
jgi:uridine kinase